MEFTGKSAIASAYQNNRSRFIPRAYMSLPTTLFWIIFIVLVNLEKEVKLTRKLLVTFITFLLLATTVFMDISCLVGNYSNSQHSQLDKKDG